MTGPRGNSTGGASDASPAILFDNVSRTFTTAGRRAAVPAIRDLSFTVEPATFVALLGPSGCGKTTILRIVDGLLQGDTGRVEVFGAPPKPGPDIGFVFQNFRLIPWANVQDNVEFGLKSMPLTRAERRERADHHLELVGLSTFRHAYPGELSGGMKQRVALARALATEPGILLMDEPFASIDAHTRELMQIELMRIWTVRRPVVLFVTHSVDEAIILADRIMLLSPRPARVIESFDVELERPRWTYDARAEPRYVELRSYLSDRMRELVVSDPASEFFGRDLVPPRGR
ncbi:ABC transporter ATP-binding protein [Oceaniovalibus sp. ACAM 378]|uniref:ABC transporter ATP-binding protein n=1 Tax=Oceaniovalibus sp. ACAM 378 TaxID=2599923 RepID=UPI0011D316B5|nr:ABC transporter ATP-binding protein [Oceaniovalibus sp. ACAM 378]TYB85228.1 ABC transporter ATP-binding protein [Oceaniovalibus sp. ACAM 378]